MPLKRYQKDFDYSYCLGTYPTIELLTRRPELCREVVVSSDSSRSEGVARVREMCEPLLIPVRENDRLVNKLSPKGDCHAVGVFGKFEAPLSPKAAQVVLVAPCGMGNLGTIMRTMPGFGIENLALVRPAPDLFHPEAVRAAMGTLFQLNFSYFDSFEEYFAIGPPPLYALATDAATHLHRSRFDVPAALVFGSEGAGLPEKVKVQCQGVRIAHRDAIDSLNVGVAAGIVLHEYARQAETE